MKPDRRSLIIPVLLITVGTGWLLTTLGVAPRVDWVWTLGLVIVGLLAFVVGGIARDCRGPAGAADRCRISALPRGACRRRDWFDCTAARSATCARGIRCASAPARR